MPNWEIQPTAGPLPYLGAGILAAIGGASLRWAQMQVFGIVLLTAGLLTILIAGWRLLRGRASTRQEP